VGKKNQSGKGFSSTPKKQVQTKLRPRKPTNDQIKEQQALTLVSQGKLNDAELIYRELVESGSKSHIVHGNLGVLLKRKGDLQNAISYFKNALQLKPDYPDAHYNLGNAFKDQGDLTAAIASYNAALQLKPNNPEAHSNLGNALQERGDLTAAIASYNAALQLRPNNPVAHYNLGNALQWQDDLDTAIASYNAALQLKPDYPEAHSNLGAALKAQGDLDAAIASYNTALQLKPNYPDAHNNLGNALQEQGDLNAAIASYNAALQLKPNYPDAQKNLSMTQLLLGDYERGWERYECRFQCKKNPVTANASPSCNQWNGENLSQGKKLLLVSEQGLGDTLQFMRYADPLRDKGLVISLCAPPKLHSLIQASGIDLSPLTPEQANQIADGWWIPLLSVPRHLGVTPANPITTEPYIKTTDELTAKWAAILGTKRNPVVGINWQGNPKAEKDGLMGRSLSLEMFSPITSSRHISFLSLQKGFGSEQLETCSFKDRFVSCQDQVNETWDFLETAAIIANCDLVITSDTSVAHLSGGMGKTTWLLLQKAPDWRWGLEGHTTFWYPSMRLFRQKERGNWNDVMKRVAEELQKHF